MATRASFAFVVVAVIAVVAAWGCGVWCAHAKGYTPWIGLLGPLVVVALPSLHPVLEELRRRESADGG